MDKGSDACSTTKAVGAFVGAMAIYVTHSWQHLHMQWCPGQPGQRCMRIGNNLSRTKILFESNSLTMSSPSSTMAFKHALNSCSACHFRASIAKHASHHRVTRCPIGVTHLRLHHVAGTAHWHKHPRSHQRASDSMPAPV